MTTLPSFPSSDPSWHPNGFTFISLNGFRSDRFHAGRQRSGDIKRRKDDGDGGRVWERETQVTLAIGCTATPFVEAGKRVELTYCWSSQCWFADFEIILCDTVVVVVCYTLYPGHIFFPLSDDHPLQPHATQPYQPTSTSNL